MPNIYDELLDKMGQPQPTTEEVGVIPKMNLKTTQFQDTQRSNVPTQPLPTVNLVDAAIASKKGETQQDKPSEDKGYDPTGKTQEQVMAETGQQSALDQMSKQPSPQVATQAAQVTSQKTDEPVAVQTPPTVSTPATAQVTRGVPDEKLDKEQPVTVQPIPYEGKGMIGGEVRVTQNFNNLNPSLYSKGNGNGGKHRGTDYGMKEGTQLSSPPEGNWVVDKAGYDKSGWGNTVKIRNDETGETLRYSHLSKVSLKPGQKLDGQTVIGLSGNTGNSTAAHLDLEYSDGKGRLGDVTKSNWGKYIQGSDKPTPAGQPAPNIASQQSNVRGAPITPMPTQSLQQPAQSLQQSQQPQQSQAIASVNPLQPYVDPLLPIEQY